MRKLIVCVTLGMSLAGCAKSPSLATLAPAKLAAPSKTCLAQPQTATEPKAGDDAVVDDAKMRRIIGDDVEGWSACQSYIHRLRG